MRRLIFAALATITLAGAAHADDNKVYVFKGDDDKFSQSISFSGKYKSHIKMFGTSTDWMIRGWVDKASRTPRYQLYLEISYSGDWHFYENAASDDGNALPMTKIDQHVDDCTGGLAGCGLTETVGIDLSPDLLKDKAATGFQIKVYAKSGNDVIIDVTPDQIQSALVTADQFLPPEKRWVNGSLQHMSRQDFKAIAATIPSAPPAPPGANGRPPLGISYLEGPVGCAVATVLPGSVAEKAGIQVGDIVTAINGAPVRNQAEMMAELNKLSPGDAAEASVTRDNANLTVKLQF